ncbi:MAG: IS630 family transposase [Thermodesulfobacteriota bacterium]
MKKKTPDARRLSHTTLTELRKRGVASVQAGQSPELVAAALGISRATIYGWLARYRDGGWDALDARKRGGREPKLDTMALRWICQTVTEKNPLQLKFISALWTAKMIGQLIDQHFKIKMSKSSIFRLLAQLGMTPRRPLGKADQQRPEEIQKWLRDDYPRIRHLARQKKAMIFFGYEAGLRLDPHAGTTGAVKGITPVRSKPGARAGLNIVSAVSSQGEFRFMTVKGRVGATQFVDFIKRLLHNATRIVFLIVDEHPAHKAKSVKLFAESVKGRFRLFFLPPYSPELNPGELGWNDLKNNAIVERPLISRRRLQGAGMNQSRLVQKSTYRTRSFFPGQTTRGAA